MLDLIPAEYFELVIYLLVWLLPAIIIMTNLYKEMQYFLQRDDYDEARKCAIWFLLTPIWPLGLALALPVVLGLVLFSFLSHLFKSTRTIIKLAFGGKP